MIKKSCMSSSPGNFPPKEPIDVPLFKIKSYFLLISYLFLSRVEKLHLVHVYLVMKVGIVM